MVRRRGYVAYHGPLDAKGMLRMVALGACFLVTLAGCSSSPAGSETSTTSPSHASSSQSILTVAPPPATTDTLFLLDPPHMTAAAPTGETIRSPVPSLADAFAAAFVGQTSAIGQVWTAPRNGLGVLEGNATLWIEVKGTVGNPGGLNQGCFWSVVLRANEDGGGGFSGTSSRCVREDAVLTPGIREMRFEFDAVDVSATVGQTISLTVATAGVYGPDGSIEVLSGSAEYPSRMSVRGISLPLDTQTLLI